MATIDDLLSECDRLSAEATTSFVEIKRLCELVIAMREGGK